VKTGNPEYWKQWRAFRGKSVPPLDAVILQVQAEGSSDLYAAERNPPTRGIHSATRPRGKPERQQTFRIAIGPDLDGANLRAVEDHVGVIPLLWMGISTLNLTEQLFFTGLYEVANDLLMSCDKNSGARRDLFDRRPIQRLRRRA